MPTFLNHIWFPARKFKMQYFVYLSAILLLTNYQKIGAQDDRIVEERLACPHLERKNLVEVLNPEIRKKIIQKLENTPYWTRISSANIEGELPIGFVEENSTIFTKIEFDNVTRRMYTYSFNVKDKIRITYHEVEYLVHETKLVFESIRHMEAPVKHEVLNNYRNLEEPLEEIKRPRVRFALIYQEDYDTYRIFQTCDGKHVWIQINDNYNDRYPKMYKIYENEIKEILAKLNVTGRLMRIKSVVPPLRYKRMMMDYRETMETNIRDTSKAKRVSS